MCIVTASKRMKLPPYDYDVHSRCEKGGQRTHLIKAGRTHLTHPSCGGNSRILPPGINMHTESHTSPNTFANEVNTSANTTSEKYIGLVEGGNRHLRIELDRAGRERRDLDAE